MVSRINNEEANPYSSSCCRALLSKSALELMIIKILHDDGGEGMDADEITRAVEKHGMDLLGVERGG